RADSAAAAATASPRADSAAAPAAGAGALTSDITAAENSWRIAVTGGDTVELGRITAPGFTMVGSTGPASTVTRATLMKQVSQGMLQADSSSVSNLTVNGSGDSATADLTFFWHVSRNGKPAKAETMQVTDSWVKKDGRWQLASRKEKAK
ncbi:MAG: nuclear transport factor 2 family protein, partial [Gemmatimonadaceae bacterium]